MTLVNRIARHLVVLFLIAMPTLLAVSSAHAQSFGQVTGTAMDTAHAVIPGAQLTLTNDSENTKLTAVSNHDGIFVFPSLVPGTYHLSATTKGFADVTTTNILVDVSKTTRVDIQFKPSSVNEQVVVNAESNTLDLDNGYKGSLIEHQEIVDLPLQTLNPLALAVLTPGVQGAAGNSAANRSGSDGSTASSGFQINGGVRSTFGGNSEYLVDGISVTNPNGGTVSALPSTAAIQEFQVQSGVMSAEFGYTTGGVVNYITRSGTSSFHGGVFEDIRNTVLNAKPALPFTTNPKPAITYNQFGANFAGPVWIPKIYDGRDKTFFLFDYEGLRWDPHSNGLATVPTDLMRQGVFTEITQKIYDPASSPTTTTWKQFPNNTILPSRFTAFGQQLINLYPHANLPGITQNFASVNKTVQNNDIYTIRGDQYFGQKHRLMYKYLHTNYASPVTTGIGVNDSGGQDVTIPTFSHTASYNYNISPHVLYTAVAGYIWSLRTNLDPSGNTVGTQYFGYNITPALASGSLQNVRPAATVALENGLGTGVPQIRKSQTKELSQIVSLTEGKHFIRLGVDLRNYICSGLVASGAPTGSWGFASSQTSQNNTSTTGNAVASLLLGLPNTINFDQEPYASVGYGTGAFFVADDWKISRDLTLNIGMRYGYYSPISEKNSLVGWLDTVDVNPIVGIPGVYQYAGINGNPNNFTGGDYKLFAPRLAFAYTPSFLHSTTVLRGGIGMYNGPLPLYSFYASSPGYNSQYAPVKLNATAPAAALQTTYMLSPAGGPVGAAGDLGTSYGGVLDHNMKSPRVTQWNLGVEHQLPFKTQLDVEYSGNRGQFLLVNEPQDLPSYAVIQNAIQLEAASGTAGTASTYLNTPVPNPLVGKVPGTLGNATVTREVASEKFPQFSAVTGYPGDRGSIYHSLQAKLLRRASHGLTYLVSYTYSKTITDAILGSYASTSNTGAIQNPYDHRESRAVSDFDSTHIITGAAVYNLPFGKGQKYLTHGFASALFGGFQLSTIMNFSSGTPIPVSQSTASGLGVGAARPDKIGDPKAGRTRLPSGAYQWINKAAYELVDGRWGNTPIRDTHLRNPAFSDIDLGLYRSFPIYKEWALQFRVQAFNVPNHTRMTAPNADAANASFGQITSSFDPRVFQLSAHIQF